MQASAATESAKSTVAVERKFRKQIEELEKQSTKEAQRLNNQIR